MTCYSWVELRGFEPLTPSMRTRCATGLRYSPENLVSVANFATCSCHGRLVADGAEPLQRVLVAVVLVGSVGEAGDLRVRGGVFPARPGAKSRPASS